MRFNYDNSLLISNSEEYIQDRIKNFESIDSLFSISGVRYTVSIFNNTADIERIETPMLWQEIALKVTVWFLSIITVIPIIAIVIAKHLYQKEINEMLMGGGYRGGYYNLSSLDDAISYLEMSDLYTRENHAALIRCRYHIQHVSKGMLQLYESNLLTQPNFDKLVAEAQWAIRAFPSSFYYSLIKSLREKNLLTQPNFDLIYSLEPSKSYLCSQTLARLNDRNLLTQANIDALLQDREHLREIASGLRKLDRAHLLTQANFNALVQNREHSMEILKGLDKLEQFRALTQTNFDALLQNPEGAYVKSALIFIKEIARAFHDRTRLDLTLDNFDALLQNPEQLQEIASGLGLLMAFNLLTLDNFIALLQNKENSKEITIGLRELSEAGLLTQANFNLLLQNPEGAHDAAQVIIIEARAHLNRMGFVDVHTRDARCRAAMELLIEAQQENISQNNISQGLSDFRAFLDRRPQSTQKENALRALIGTRQETMPPFLGPQDMWSVYGLVLTGEEVIGRLWCFANTLTEKDQTNVKLGMIKALEKSIEDDQRICNPGKVSHLLHTALQGYLPGVNLDPEIEEAAPITAYQGAILFFNANQTNLMNGTINTRELLNARGNAWLEENRRVTDREGFFRQLEDYANAESWQ